MSKRPIDPITQRRRMELGRELFRLRALAGRSMRAVATDLHVSQTTILRYERGELVPNRDQLTAFAAFVDAPPGALDALLDLASQAHTTVTPWSAWAGRGYAKQTELADLEQAACTILAFQSQVVPGLLQARDYARRVFALSDVANDEDYTAKVAGRIARQAILLDEAKRFEFLITEAALLWPAGPDAVMVTQLDHIANLATRDNITIGIIPLDLAKPASMVWVEAFDLYLDFADGSEPRAIVELVADQVTLSDPEKVAAYRATYDALREDAKLGDQALALLATVRREFAG